MRGFGGIVRLVACAAIAAALAAPAAAKPTRIVSLNLCTDQLVLQLADRSRIASLTFNAVDPDLSYMWEAARGLPVNRGRAEEILPLEPDLVLAYRFSATAAVQLLRRLGYTVHMFDLPQSLDGVRAQIRQVAELLGERARGEALVAELDAGLKAARAPAGRRPLAAIYGPRATMPGSGTLTDAVLAAAGLENLGTRLGLAGVMQVPLETVLLAAPEVFVIEADYLGDSSLAAGFLRHPALAHLREAAEVVRVPQRLWFCGGPQLAEAVRRVAAARARVVGADGGGEP